jgi:predicted nucleotide-binding protein (sugar kinase/HSP70/actin superfamily)
VTCKGCTNRCAVLRLRFPNGNLCYSGNKCEKVFSASTYKETTKGYNAFEERVKIWDEVCATANSSPLCPVAGTYKRGSYQVIGIPRALNIYEHFPFWNSLFTACGFKVALSPESNMELYRKGIASVMSDNICFPAKLVHGHISALADADVDFIFYPIVPMDTKELVGSTKAYNCPVVCGYPEVIRSSIDPEAAFGIPFHKPVMNFGNLKALKRQCYNYLSSILPPSDNYPASFSKHVFNSIFDRACEKQSMWVEQYILAQKAILKQAESTGKLAFVVAGRPYHADTLVNQKTGQILSDMGVDVLTDDVFRDADSNWDSLNIVSQWSYPNRVVQAAMQVARLPRNVQLLQLNSFGCGPDSFYMEETGAILRQAGKNHAVLRIDEIASPGSVRLRLRSLIESLTQSNARYSASGCHSNSAYAI